MMVEILVRFFGGAEDGHQLPLPQGWDAASPPELVWLRTERAPRTGYTVYPVSLTPPGDAYRHDVTVAPLLHPDDDRVELHYERFEQADEAADLHSG